MRRKLSSQYRFLENRQRQSRRERVRKLTFDSLEDRRLLAGLNIFVYDDANGSDSWQSASESPLAEQVVYVDSDNDARLDSNEPYALTDVEGKALLDNLSIGIAMIRLLGSSTPAIPVDLPSSNSRVDLNVAGKASNGNHAPVLGAIPSQSLDEDSEISLPSSLLQTEASDADQDSLIFFVVGQPSNGSLTWSVETGGTYKPNPNFNGTDAIVVRAFDGKSWSSPVTLDLTINSVDDLPTAIQFASGSIPENQLGYVIGSLTIIDIDGGPNTVLLTPDDIFEFKDGKLKLLDSVALNYEENAASQLTVKVVVGESEILTLESSFTLPVLNRNDAPSSLIFQGQTRVEEFVMGFEFGTITVDDEDVGDQYNFIVSDSRFAVVDGKLLLKPGVSLFYDDATHVPVTVRAVSQTSSDEISESFDIQVVRAAPPWQNKHWALDVNDDGLLTPLDVLLVINALNRIGAAPLDRPPPAGSANFVDVNGDRFLSPIDALILINALNRQSRSGEGSQGNNPGGNGSGGSGSGEGNPPEGEAPLQPAPQQYAPSPKSDSSRSVANTDSSTNAIDDEALASTNARKSARRVR